MRVPEMTRSRPAPSRKDQNHDEIARALAKVAKVTDVHAYPGIGCDLLVDSRGVTYRVEIKDGELPPGKRKLTETESSVRHACLAAGTSYVIARDVAEALCALGFRGCNNPAYPCGFCGTLDGPARFRGRGASKERGCA